MRFLLDLYESQSGICPLSGVEMDCRTDHEYGFLLKPSLDRINNSRGYERDNVRFTTVWANLQRNFLNDAQFTWLCGRVVETQGRRKRTTKPKRRDVSRQSTNR
jgi:hypothetical protein